MEITVDAAAAADVDAAVMAEGSLEAAAAAAGSGFFFC